MSQTEQELVNLDDYRFIPAASLKDKEGNQLDAKVLEALPRLLTFKEYQIFIGEKPYATEELALMPEFDENTKLRLVLNTKMNELADTRYYYQLESEAKGVGDLHRRDLAEDILSLLKQIIGSKEEQIWKDFAAYNDRKMQEYLEKKTNENNN